MKTFNNRQEVNDAGYAFPCYDISRVTRTWRYNGKIFTTVFDVPVERVMWKSYELEVLPMGESMSKTDMSGLINIAADSFVGTSVEDAAPSGGVLYPPYEARPANDNNPNGWWFVANNLFNTLSFKSKRGAKFTDKKTALAIVEKWNSLPKGTKFDIPPDPYVAPVTTRLTDEEMSTYVRSRVYKENGMTK